MAAETRPDVAQTYSEVLRTGAVAGLLAGVGMGVVLSVGTGLMPLIGALYGLESFAWGWVAHLINSVVFALVFATIVSRSVVRESARSIGSYVGYGLLYGAMLEIVTGGILFPLWLAAAGDPALAVPFFPIPGTVERFVPAIVLGLGHLVYGAILGAAYGWLAGRS